ncbi:hypothetical protein PENTCL1PPCAC_25508, partial [Pristionchus entomophagus]
DSIRRFANKSFDALSTHLVPQKALIVLGLRNSVHRFVEADRRLIPIENVPHDVRHAPLFRHLRDRSPEQLTVLLLPVFRSNDQLIHRHGLSLPAVVREVVQYHAGRLHRLIIDHDESSEAVILKVLCELLPVDQHFRFQLFKSRQLHEHLEQIGYICPGGNAKRHV